MNEAKVNDLDYINFLVASPKVVSCTEAARVQPDQPRRAAHDALTRLLHRLDPDPTPLWQEAKQHVTLDDGLLIVDDTTLDKPYARQIELSTATGPANIIALSRGSIWSRCCGATAHTPSHVTIVSTTNPLMV